MNESTQISKKQLFHVSASPHTRRGLTTSIIMADVAIALLPACAMGIYQFGFRAFLVLLVSVVSCMLSEYFWMRFMKKPVYPYECSAVVTGLLLGMNLPASIPLWIPLVGGVFAIIVVKQLFGGLGQNFMNPALAARCFLMICFTGRMTDFAVAKLSPATAGKLFYQGVSAVDGITGATPLAVLKAGGDIDLFDAFFGFTGGVIGETSAALILLGAVYLAVRRIISLRIPLTYLLTVAVFVLIFGGRGFDLTYAAAELCTGGLMLGAFFMATDYASSPITPVGRLVYGVLLGILTGIFRIFGGAAEGVSYAIILGNLLVPLIEKCTLPKAFGKGVKANG